MIRDGTSVTRRIAVALLAAWMAVFAVLAGIHNHGILGSTARRVSLDQPGAVQLQVGTCFACLASHVPVPTPDRLPILSSPLRAQGVLPAEITQPVRSASWLDRSSRAPPASSDILA